MHKAGSQHFQVLRNAAADLGLWPLGATTPAGWRPVGFHGSWERCLAYVATLGATQGAMPGQPAVDAPDPSPFVGAWAGVVARHAGRTAVAEGGLVWSFAELDERVSALVSRLRARGVRGGDQLAVPAAAGAGVVAMLAAVHTGAVAVLPSPFVATTPHRAVDGLGFYDRSDRAAHGGLFVHYGQDGQGTLLDPHQLAQAPIVDVQPGDAVVLDPAGPLYALVWHPLTQGATVVLGESPAPSSLWSPSPLWWRTDLEVRPVHGPVRQLTVTGRPETGAVAQVRDDADGHLLVALPGRRLHVLAGNLRPARAGRLYVGGTGLARGYLGTPALTCARWLPDPYGPPGERIFADDGQAVAVAGGIRPV